MNCAYCGDPADFACSCALKVTYMCSKHVGNHYKLKGKHKIEQIKSSHILFNLEMKAMLIEKIQTIKAQAKLDINKTIAHTKNIVKEISKDMKNFSRYMSEFVKSCDYYINIIKKLDSKTEEKEFYPPLESLLIMEDPEILDHFYAPKITLYSISKKIIKCVPSAFPHSLFQYCYNTITFSTKNELSFYDNKQEKKITTNLNWTGRLLSVGKNLVIYTGGHPASKNVFSINLESQEIVALPSMLDKRKWHAMAWIDGFPAVIGGHDEEIYLNEVEIYKNKNWEKCSSLNSKRRFCEAITCFSKVYVFGGTIKNEGNFYILNSIEKYENGVWIDLPVKISLNYRSYGLFISGIYIIIFGGNDKKNNYYNDCSILNERTFNCWKIEYKLEKNLKFLIFNCLTLNNELYAYGYEKRTKYTLTKLEFNI